MTKFKELTMERFRSSTAMVRVYMGYSSKKTVNYEIWQQDGKTTSRMYMRYNHEYFVKSKYAGLECKFLWKK